MTIIFMIAIFSLLEAIVTILKIANGEAFLPARHFFYFNLDTSDNDILYGYNKDEETLKKRIPGFEQKLMSRNKKRHTDNEERCMKREATDTESCYPAKRAKWLPFFSLRPFVLKRKIPDCEEPAAGAVMKRSRQFPAFIQLTRVFFIKEIREKNCTQELKENLNPPRKKVTFADKVQISVFCKHEPIVLTFLG
ncbi:hypothetical protein EDC94DRAFT_597025 [Helicostylum pulchrum]|nr:hypothetical protein EDC94DRAFT_597025 [Helicostylum pulchrum]